MPNLANYLTTSVAQQTTGVPKRTIIAAITRGKLPATKLPGLTGSYLIDPTDLDTWLATRKTKVPA